MRPTFDPDAVALFQGKHLLPSNFEIVLPNLTIQAVRLAGGHGARSLDSPANYRDHRESPAGYHFTEVISRQHRCN